MHEIIQKIYDTRAVVGRSGKVHTLDSEIDPDEGQLIFNVIRQDPSVVRTLEVGCAHGLSSLFICSALQGRAGVSHTIIDPFENTRWDGAGIKNLEEAGFRFYEHIEARSEFALPRLLEKNEAAFDFIFIDGWHTFDHTLLDCFYATRLLKIGGYLVIDDVVYPSISRVVQFLMTYPCYELFQSVVQVKKRRIRRILGKIVLLPLLPFASLKRPMPLLFRRVYKEKYTTMIALKKMTEDKRKWDWHSDAF